ncbi:MAG: sterol desaturase family protein [Nevskiales bacterium]|nr:sterol desaturase family protein [Nevskiales bacterium]
MDARQAAFRAEYQQKISPRYSGWLHGAWIAGAGLGYIGVVLAQVDRGGWAWLSFAVAFAVANLGEWALHRYVLHRRIPALSALWHRHTVEHHHYFTQDCMTVDSHREYRIIFFPPYAVLGIAAIHLLLGALWSLPFGRDAMWIWMAGGMSHYLLYEILHTAAHLPEHPLLRRLPAVNTMRRNHWIHHHHALMSTWNMNLTVPLADWLFGSSDLDCGLWRTLGNGYRMDRLRPEVRDALPDSAFPPSAAGRGRDTAARS